MKNLITLLILVVSINSQAQVDSITTLEQQGKSLQAMQLAIAEYQKISRLIKFDEFVTSVKSKVVNQQKEVVTDTTYKENSWNTKFFLIGELSLKRSDQGSSSSKTNETAWIAENSEEFSAASTQVERDLVQLKNNVKQYALDNKLAMHALKKLATKALQLSSQIDDKNFLIYFQTLESLYSVANYFQFTGEQIILRCEVKKHAKTDSYDNYSNKYDYAASDYGVYISGKGSVEQHVRHSTKAYTEKNCTSEAKQSVVSVEGVLELEFQSIDALLNDWYGNASARYLVLKKAPEAYYWGR